MGESEARTVTAGWSIDPDSVPDPREEARKKRLLDATTIRAFGEPEPVREIWTGKLHELAKKLRDELGNDRYKQGKLTAAFERAAQRYVQKNGKAIKAKNLRESLRQAEAKQAGYVR